MLAKNIFGILILLFNTIGVGYLIYLGTLSLLKRFAPNETIEENTGTAGKRKRPVIINDDIIPDEDDLLKDMDLSDLDNLNLDDFE
ncbi:MAG: hypothetical protein KKF12_18110 [Proteobacteria bacterium]|nr:hypothetical protein [Desulfobacula sp.]MBU4132735.1 hypothetical protein [Pseudomonadota bacterium]